MVDRPAWYRRKSWLEAEVDLSDFGGGLGTVVIQDGKRADVNEYEKAVAKLIGDTLDDDALACMFKAYVWKGYDGMPPRGSDLKTYLAWLKAMHDKPIKRLAQGVIWFRAEQNPEAIEAGKG